MGWLRAGLDSAGRRREDFRSQQLHGLAREARSRGLGRRGAAGDDLARLLLPWFTEPFLGAEMARFVEQKPAFLKAFFARSAEIEACRSRCSSSW